MTVSRDLGDQVVNAALKEKTAPLAALEADPDDVFWTLGNHKSSVGMQGNSDFPHPLPLKRTFLLH